VELNGLIRKSLIPASRHCAFSSAQAWAVMAMIGVP
jgi:hypothetical protein